MSILQKIRMIRTLGMGVAGTLPSPSEYTCPFPLFTEWFDHAEKAGIFMPEATCLSSCDANNRPSSRMILMKSFDENGFVFYTNYGSRKAQELDNNPYACLLFHWTTLQRQVRVEGKVSRVSHKTSEAYFQSRNRGSKIGAWASRQSQPLDSRETLKAREKDFQKKFPGEVPLPDFWGGYRLDVDRFEFWQGRANRLHDRLIYEKDGTNWNSLHLNP